MYVLGLCGFSGSGKSSIAQNIYNKYKDCIVISIGDLIRKRAKEENNELNFNNLQNFNDKLKEEMKEKYISIVYDFIDSNKKFVIIDSLRTMDDFNLLNEKFKEKFILIAIKASEDLRFKRIKMRQRVDSIKSKYEFHTLVNKEKEWGTEELIKKSLIQIENDGNNICINSLINTLNNLEYKAI